MKLKQIFTLIIFISTLFISCSDNSCDNNDNINEVIPRTLISKVTIAQGPDYFYFPNSITSFVLNYDSNQKLNSIDIETTRNESGMMNTYNATYLMVYQNDKIIKAYTDCATNDCEWDHFPQTEGFLQISFEYGLENGLESIRSFEQIENTAGNITYSIEISRYLLNQNDLVKRVEYNTEIIYSNNNIIGIQNSSSFNDGLQYLDYDNKKSVPIFTDDSHVIDVEDYFTRLILDLKYSKNNFTKLEFDYRNQHQVINFEYDTNNRPTKRTVFNNSTLNYEEVFEYLE